jgi:hypothetical protein
MKAIFATLTALVAMAPAAAWTQRADRNVDKPIVRSFNWFDFVAAKAAITSGLSTMPSGKSRSESMRSSCSPMGQPE